MARRACVLVVLAVLALIAVPPGRAESGPATDALRPAIDTVLQILKDPALQGAARAPERRAALRAVMERVIDFPDAARRALGVHWRARTEAERREFIALFEDIVTYSYIVNLEAYGGETVVFLGESADDGAVTVLTKIENRRGVVTPVAYRTHERDAHWLVYDVLVEGVSLVGNYRAQFSSIIQTSSYAELVRRLRARAAGPPA